MNSETLLPVNVFMTAKDFKRKYPPKVKKHSKKKLTKKQK